ncbi:MAG: DUF1508 domain-containing protein [Solirubrobacteraceae bacterium]
MGTAPKKSRAARQLARRGADANVPASMEFLIFADNGGSYHWRLRADDGAILGDSGGFASYDDAEHAAQQVCGGAASARFAPRSVDAVPVDLSARRDASSDNSDAERWLDERGSSSTEAVTKWAKPR